ncbi:hypothetical protein [Tenacibaculum larymnensis]|uniref:Uncharacterized protein n=1 Tax=Tenacibaculum larymnensis TaxID=2878201 RepID=A0A9X4EM55_9FLAO|nr:hypothetical protein [Tenacibaculum larymnensis]MDE1206526.1 hypothetical protein [Tenacibaculum larymnensis]
MHWKTKKKLLSTQKLYLTHKDINSEFCYEIRFQLPNNEYVLIDLRHEIPSRIRYESLIPNGFGYNEDTDNPIIIYRKKIILKYLENTKKEKGSNIKTLDTIIDLVNEMENLVNQ